MVQGETASHGRRPGKGKEVAPAAARRWVALRVHAKCQQRWAIGQQLAAGRWCFIGNGRTMARRSWARGKLRKMRPRVRWADALPVGSFTRDRPSVQQPARPQPFWDHARGRCESGGPEGSRRWHLPGYSMASATVAAKLPATSPLQLRKNCRIL